MASSEEHYVGQLLTPTDTGTERDAIRELLIELLSQQSDTQIIRSTGDLIEYIRDQVLSSLAGIRRAAANNARLTMSPDQIASATGLSKATVSRLITERRSY
jgi:CRP-like cAMP-binding protein